MRVLFVTGEVFPLAKTGGLADVSAALPAALTDLGVDVRLLIPGYPEALARAGAVREVAPLDAAVGRERARLLSSRLPGNGVPVWLIDCPSLYDRVGGIYQDDGGVDWPDNAMRFGLLNQVAALIGDGAIADDWRPDVIHSNDWHAALVPYLIAKAKLKQPATVLTIHNLAYQGIFDRLHLEQAGLIDSEDTFAALEYYGRGSFLKAGIAFADALTTVSPTYAAEILTQEYGCGLDGLLRQRSSVLKGILNGIDLHVWNPSTDVHLKSNYSHRNLTAKPACKSQLQSQMGLEISPATPLAAYMSRLCHQKMPDAVLEALPGLLENDMQFALVAQGDAELETRFQQIAQRYPGKVAVRTRYEEPLAHSLLAGADLLLHPAHYEPCGLTQMYAMRYGTVPIVRRTGGLADTVTDPEAKNGQAPTGFCFDAPNANDLSISVERALTSYRQPIAWRKLQLAGMRQDFSWQRSASTYLDLYRAVANIPADRPAARTAGARRVNRAANAATLARRSA